MKTAQTFGDGGSCVMAGDSIEFEHNGQAFRAWIEPDTITTPYDADCYPDPALRAWGNDEWQYVGVVVARLCASCGSVPADAEVASLWGIEANLPGLEKACADSLTEVAYELAEEL